MKPEEEEEEEGLFRSNLTRIDVQWLFKLHIMDSVFQLHLKEVSCALCAALLLLFTVTSAEEAAHVKNSQCHNYAGGHVYPGEAFRVPVSDHSLHLSKAKSEFLSFFFFFFTCAEVWRQTAATALAPT